MDPRKGNPFYYDLDETPLEDVPFYLKEIDPSFSVLELGCGTGRTLIPIAKHCKEIVGIDYSADMIEHCRSKLTAEIKAKCKTQVGDITNLNLGKQFDCIIAPYRVMQALATDQELEGLFSSIQRHLKPGGFCILNAFRPKLPREELLKAWEKPVEEKMWEKTLPDGSRITHIDRKEKIEKEPMVLIVKLIYQKYIGDKMIKEFTQPIKMRCYYPEEYKQRIESNGFKILQTWGGYHGEKYGEGPELVVKFTL